MSRLSTLIEITEGYSYACEKIDDQLLLGNRTKGCKITGYLKCEGCILGRSTSGNYNLVTTTKSLQGNVHE